VPSKASTPARIVAVSISAPANALPVVRIVSPSAMIKNRRLRSIMCSGAKGTSTVRNRRPGRRCADQAPMRSIDAAASHHHSLVSGSVSAPIIHSAVDGMTQITMLTACRRINAEVLKR
jgi:hypothetical protein